MFVCEECSDIAVSVFHCCAYPGGRSHDQSINQSIIVTGCVTMVIAHGFCLTCSSINGEYTIVSDSPSFFWSPPGHALAMCTRLFLLLKGLGTRLSVDPPPGLGWFTAAINPWRLCVNCCLSHILLRHSCEV